MYHFFKEGKIWHYICIYIYILTNQILFIYFILKFQCIKTYFKSKEISHIKITFWGGLSNIQKLLSSIWTKFLINTQYVQTNMIIFVQCEARGSLVGIWVQLYFFILFHSKTRVWDRVAYCQDRPWVWLSK